MDAKAQGSTTGILLGLALIFVAMHVATSSPYGFHRDELATLDDARHMEWGFVAYPPLTPAAGRLALAVFGVSTLGVRVLPIIALAVALLAAGLMARELGGSRRAQVLTSLAVAFIPIVTIQTSVLQYVSFDYLWGVLLTYLLLRLLNSDDMRWWMAIGAVIGMGMMTKYTMAFFVTGLVGGLVATGMFEREIRKQLRSPWLWAGVAVSLVIFLPNLIWQIQHHFISLDFLRHIHVRDVGQGRTHGFLPEQLYVCVSAGMVPLAFMGFGSFQRAGKKISSAGLDVYSYSHPLRGGAGEVVLHGSALSCVCWRQAACCGSAGLTASSRKMGFGDSICDVASGRVQRDFVLCAFHAGGAD